MRRFFRARVRSLLLIAILIAIALLIGLHSQAGQGQWQLAKNAAPPGLLNQVVQENLQPKTPFDAEQMKLWRTQQPGQKRSLYLIDTRTSSAAEQPHRNLLCGQRNCLFLGYLPTSTSQYQRVLALYLNPHLPPKVPLLMPTSDLHEGLPCLVTHQLIRQKIQAAKLCFNGTAYEVLETQQLPNRYE